MRGNKINFSNSAKNFSIISIRAATLGFSLLRTLNSRIKTSSYPFIFLDNNLYFCSCEAYSPSTATPRLSDSQTS